MAAVDVQNFMVDPREPRGLRRLEPDPMVDLASIGVVQAQPPRAKVLKVDLSVEDDRNVAGTSARVDLVEGFGEVRPRGNRLGNVHTDSVGRDGVRRVLGWPVAFRRAGAT